MTKHRFLVFFMLLCGSVSGVALGQAQEINARAREDAQSGIAKAKEADKFFLDKKWSDATAAFAESNKLLKSAAKRDDKAGAIEVIINEASFPGAMTYGYADELANGGNILPGGTGIKLSVTDLRHMLGSMGADAGFLSGSRKFAWDEDSEAAEISQDTWDIFYERASRNVMKIELPVRDDQWLSVLKTLKRSLLFLDAAGQLQPELLNKKDQDFSLKAGDESRTLADVIAEAKDKLKEAEPEWQKVAQAAANAVPKDFETTLNLDLEALDEQLKKVSETGFLPGSFARDVYLTKDYLTQRRKMYQKFYDEAGKAMPADALKPLENKAAQIKSVIDKNAPRWSFPTDKPHDATIETRVKSLLKAQYPGATIVKIALATPGWTIHKDTAQMPTDRARALWVLMQFPGEKWLRCAIVDYIQDYAGGDTYESAGQLGFGLRDVRFQTNK